MTEFNPSQAGVPSRNRVDVELDESVRQARMAAEELGRQMAGGETPPEKLAAVMASVGEVVRRAQAASGNRSQALLESVQALLASLQSAREAGSVWLEQVAVPELERLARGRHAMNTYRQRGFPPDEGSVIGSG